MSKSRDVPRPLKRSPRPLKRSEYAITFISREAQKGWTDCLAMARNATVDAWDALTTQPATESPRLYRLRGDMRYGTYQGRTYERYQYKITDGARIWYFVEPGAKGRKCAGTVLLERCTPGHPKQTE